MINFYCKFNYNGQTLAIILRGKKFSNYMYMYFRSIHILLHRILRNQRSIHSPFSTSFSFGEVSRFERHNIVTYPKTSTPYESAITTVWVKPATQPREVTSPWPKIKSRICDPTKGNQYIDNSLILNLPP